MHKGSDIWSTWIHDVMGSLQDDLIGELELLRSDGSWTTWTPCQQIIPLGLVALYMYKIEI